MRISRLSEMLLSYQTAWSVPVVSIASAGEREWPALSDMLTGGDHSMGGADAGSQPPIFSGADSLVAVTTL